HEHAAEEMAREGGEATRVLYVAATRARDLLVVPALGDGRYDGWLQALTPVLYPPPPRVHLPETRQPPGCPAFGVETTTGRPHNVPRPPDAVVGSGDARSRRAGVGRPRAAEDPGRRRARRARGGGRARARGVAGGTGAGADGRRGAEPARGDGDGACRDRCRAGGRGGGRVGRRSPPAPAREA